MNLPGGRSDGPVPPTSRPGGTASPKKLSAGAPVARDVTTRRDDLRTALRTVRRRPSSLAAGGVVAWAWVTVVGVLGAADGPAEAIAGQVIVTAGAADPGAFGASVAEATLFLVRFVLLLALLVVLLEVVHVLIVVPVDATVATLVRDEAEGWLAAVRATARDLPQLLATGLLSRGLAVALFPFGAGLAVAAYLTAGTGLEAVGYALGLYSFVPFYVPLLALVAATLVGRRLAGSVPGRPDLVLAAVPELSVRAAVRTAAAGSSGAVRTRLADGAVVTGLLAVPLVVATTGTLLFEWVDPDRGSSSLVALVTILVAFVTTGAVCQTVTSAYATLRSDRRRPDRATAGGGIDWRGVRRSLPVLKVVAVAGLVVAATVAGGAVRHADLTPGSREAAPPGPANGDDPAGALRGGEAAVSGTSHATVSRGESRRVYDNGTRGKWKRRLEVRLRVDRDDEQVRFVGLIGNSSSTVTYLDQATFAQARLDGTRATDEAAVRAADWLVFPRIPGVVLGARDQQFDGDTVDLPSDADWRVVDGPDDRLVLVSADPAAVSAASGSNPPADAVRNGSIRVEIDRSTGYFRRITVEYLWVRPDEPFDVERRTTVRFEGYGTTDVERPAGMSRPVLAELIDVLFY